MPTITIQAEVPVETLLQAAEQLSAPELQRLITHLLALRARRVTPGLEDKEALLLQRIHQRLPVEVQQRYEALLAQRDRGTLDADTYAELLRLTQQTEAFDVGRLEALSQLAAQRGVTLSEVVRQLDVALPTHG